MKGERLTKACPCPKHPFGCYGHPHNCGCAKEARDLTRPIVGIENRTAQEVFDIMADRIRLALSRERSGE